MKKILSLLSMLMITVTAFATSYTDKLTYKLTVMQTLTKELPAGELTVEPYGTSNYTVTAKGCDFSEFDAGNWDEIVCEDVAGTTDANGVTTITLDNPYAYRTSDNATFTDTKLVVKFNGTKAYAHFEGKMKVMYVARAFEYTFGTDEGFESTGGGSTGGGEEKPAAFEKVNFVGDGTNFNWSIPVDWDTQKIVMSIDPSTCTGACEDIIGLGEVATAWDNTLHLYRKPNGTLQGYFNVPGGSNNNTNPFDETNPIKVEVSKAKGFVVNDVVKIPASEMSALFALSTVNMGTGEGNNDKSRATYNYVKVVDKDWTETTEPEVTVTFEKQYADQLYSLADGTPSAMGDATVTLKEMSDNTISMSLAFSDMNVESTDLVKGTDEKDRITYTGTANFQGKNFAVKALRYTKDEEEKLYMTLTTAERTLAFGTDPDYVAPAEPEDVTLWENYQADGTGFSKTATINWDKQKIVASIDFSNGGDDKDILAMTTGESFAAFQTSTYRTMHWYCNQSVKQMSGFFAKSGAGNNNTGRFDVADCLAKFEISKAEGLKVNGVVKMTPEALDELFASNTVLIGSGESPKFSQAFYNYIKVVSLDWTETTTPDTPEAVVYKNELTIVRGADHKVYNDAEVSVLAKGEGKYEVTLPEFADMDLTNSGTVGKIVFTANGEEVDGVLKLTAENAAGVISTGEGWTKYAADVTMSGEVANNQLAAKFTVVLGGMSDYTYTLGYGKEIFIPTTETVTDWANIKFGDSDPVNIENAKLDITMVSMSTAMVTFKDVMINGNNIGDFAISGVKASINTDDYTTTVLTTEATKGTWVRATENNALGVIVGAESDIRNFEGTQDENAGKTVVKFGVFFGSAYGWADIVFGEKVDTPEPPVVEDYAINFDKDAKQTHTSRYSTSVSLQQEGKDKQTIEFGKTMNGYEDLTTGTDKFTVEAGSEVTPSIGYVGEWMHGYVYIDLDNNKQFSFNADGADQTGTEVVSYSYYKNQNSKGEAVESNCNVNPMPAFTAPTTPGTYRIRFKVDWDNIDAGGSVATGNSILNNGGGIYDATLEVVEPVTDGISTINAEVANGEAQLFTVDGVQIAKLQKGLNIVRTADGKVKKVLVK
uniref:calycin-like domain-containing protein n=1 Tax=Prevotella sp. TaxID=59823 RepID=UPI004028D5F2